MSAKSLRVLSLLTLLVIVQAACFLPITIATQPSPADDTAVMQTAFAQVAGTLTQVALQGGAIQSPPPSPQQPTATPTDTPLPTLTPTITLTPTPEGAWISVSTDTRCRRGPGKTYDQIGGLPVGKMVQVFGKDPSGQYYYIRNPDDPASFCWVWGFYATPQGSFAAVPVFTPAVTSTPSPDFKVSFKNVDSCVGWFIEYHIENTGGIGWESVQVKTTDPTTSVILNGPVSNTFEDWNGCLVSVAQQDLMPGEAGETNSGFSFGYNPAGHALQATITLCSQNGLAGTCLVKTLNFTP
jgi:hypothetical protein